MRPLESLTYEAVVGLLTANFTRMADGRDPQRLRYGLRDTLLSGYAMFFLQHPSLLQFQESMKRKRGRCNLEVMFGVSAVPSETQMRESLDGADPEGVRAILPQLFERVRRAGWATHFQTTLSGGATAGTYYVMALDGTDYFHSTCLSCPQCLVRADREGVAHYRHTVVAATVVRAGSHRILPVDAEMCQPQDGAQKQDCEVEAAKRLIGRVRHEHRQLPLIVTGDDLYSHVPFVQALKQQRMHYIVVAKPSSHAELWEWVEDLERLKATEWVEWRVGPACQQKSYRARIARCVPLRQDAAVEATFVEVWETKRKGEQVYHNSWVTDLAVTAGNVAEVVHIGRAKWKIENEQFNVQKNGGYHLTHNYGHGQQHLSAVFYYLNLLAYVTHVILELGDRLYKRVREMAGRRDELWHGVRTLVNYFVWQSWAALLEHMLDDEAGLPP